MIRFYAMLSICLFSCGSSPQDGKAHTDSLTVTDTSKSKKQFYHVPGGKKRDKNDTNQVLYYARSRDVYDLNAWHIVYSDSMNSAISMEFSKNSLPKWYNFDNDHLPLYFDCKNGVYTLRKLYLSHADMDIIIPYAMFFSGDTLFTTDTFKTPKSLKSYRSLHFEEVLYVFRTKKNIGSICDYAFMRTDGGQKQEKLVYSKSSIVH